MRAELLTNAVAICHDQLVGGGISSAYELTRLRGTGSMGNRLRIM